MPVNHQRRARASFRNSPHPFHRAIVMAALGLTFLLVAREANAERKDKPMKRGGTSTPAATMEDWIQQYRADWTSMSRFHDLRWSPASYDQWERFYRSQLDRLAEVQFESLGQQGQIDYVLLRNKLRSSLADLALDRRWLGELGELLPFREALQGLELSRLRLEPVDAAGSATKVAAFAEQVKKLRERLEKGKKEGDKSKGDAGNKGVESKSPAAKTGDVAPLKISASLAKRTAQAVNELRQTLKRWYAAYDGYQPDFTWWLKKPYSEADAALESYAKFLREEIAGLKGKEEDPLVGDPIGRDALLQELDFEMIPYSPEELIAIGEKEFAWCEAEMKRTAAKMGFGKDWKAALARVKSLHVPPGKQDSLVVEQARDAIKFVRDHKLVTVPKLCEDTWRLTIISSDQQKTMPYAAYSGQSMLVAYAREDMKHDDKLMSMRGNNRHFTRIVTAHELIPGHHLQIFTADRHRPYRLLFSTPFLVEGWALYWETRLWDLNYARSPEDRIGMLFWRMHRCARIIVSLKFHLGQMKPAEMVEYLVERVGHERLGATSEVRRFISSDYSPLYQCAYMIGGLQLRALRKELTGTGKLSEQQFNDTVLTYGPIPIELIRAGMKDLPLTRESRASWRFAD